MEPIETEPATSVKLDIDLNTFTIAEVELVEDYAGVPFVKIPTLLKEGASAKVLRALAFIAMKRSDPDATMEAAGNVKVTDLFDRQTKAGAALPPPPPAPSGS